MQCFDESRKALAVEKKDSIMTNKFMRKICAWSG